MCHAHRRRAELYGDTFPSIPVRRYAWGQAPNMAAIARAREASEHVTDSHGPGEGGPSQVHTRRLPGLTPDATVTVGHIR